MASVINKRKLEEPSHHLSVTFTVTLPVLTHPTGAHQVQAFPAAFAPTLRRSFDMASFSNAVPSSSRSPSPHTPEASDNVDPIVLQNDLDLASWFSNGKGISVGSEFDVNMNAINDTNTKHEDDAMLRLDDLLERHAFEEYARSTLCDPS